MRVSLVFPPQWTAAQPYAAMASLNGELRRAGHRVTVQDLNLDFFEYVLAPRTLHLSRRRLDSEIAGLTAEVKLRLLTDDLSEKLQVSGRKLQVLEEYARGLNGTPEQLQQHAPAALAALRDSAQFYDPESLIAAMGLMDAAFKLYSRPFWPSEAKWNDFSNPAIPYNLAPMLAFCEETLHNPFRRYYEERLGSILDEEPEMLAVSVGSFSQVLPGLTLARMLREAIAGRKQAGKQVPHLGLGGNFFSRLLVELKGKPEFFRNFCDSLVMGEGEVPLVELAAALEKGAPLSTVPNLLWLDGETVLWTGEGPARPMKHAAGLDFDGFDTPRYLSPEVVACVAASKGCYYGECAFCDSHFGLQADELGVEDLVIRLKGLRDRHGVKHVEFIDQCIEPQYMDRMCDAFLQHELGIRWFCNARTEPGFTPALLRKMKQAGCTMVMWGVESASARLLKLMRKGISPKERLEVLRASSAAGLWNFAYIFFGFPTETEEEAMATVQMLKDNRDIIHSYGRSVFTLGKHAPLFEHKEEFGILSYVEDKQEFSTNLSYVTASGLQEKDLFRIAENCREVCREAWGDPLWMLLRSRENLHLYLAHHGPEYVRNWRKDEVPGDGPQPRPEFIF